MDISINSHQLQKIYEKSQNKLKSVKNWHLQPFTLAEKILYAHLTEPKQEQNRGQGFLSLQPDRVAMQDVTAQMALLQFMLSGKKQAAVPTTIHCDHLIQAWKGFKEDTQRAVTENNEVFQFLSSASSHYHLGFWKPGAGIIHQVILENYAFPGGLLIGTDSHTPNAGGLGMLAVGVGGADASDVMAGLSWEVKNPFIVGVHLKGQLKGWSSPKDIILKLLGIMTVKGGTNKIIEYFGEGCSSISCTGKATITNMGAELGATCSVFPYDTTMLEYLQKTNRTDLATVIESHKEFCQADAEVLSEPHKYYDEVIEIDLSTLEPQIAGPHSPDAVHSLSDMKKLCQKEKWPVQLSAALIGSCTNSSYEDIGRAAHVASQAAKANYKMPQHFLVTPGSEMIYKTIKRDGYITDLEAVGAVVMANACGPCIGQWKRTDYKKGEVNTIVNSFNRNFRGRNDANPETLSFIASPEITMALGLAGRLDFNPQTDSLNTSNGPLKLEKPTAKIFPQKGFLPDEQGYVEPSGQTVSITVNPQSERLQLLTPFEPWTGKDLTGLLILCKAKGKCTTDHISPAGFWLRYRGHLDRISDNMLLGAANAFNDERGSGLNLLTGEKQPFSKIARHYKQEKKGWIIVGGDNYGEGSSREHAAMTPRYLGCLAVIVKSFARIHETNLKKQGILPLMLDNLEDYDKFGETDRISILNLADLAPGSHHEVILHRKNKNDEDSVLVRHSMNKEQIKWFQAGSALNVLRQSKNPSV